MNGTTTLSEPVTLTAPVLEPWAPPTTRTPIPNDPKWEREYQAFQQLLPQLLTTHRGQYVAIHEGQVAGSGADELVLIEQVWERIGHVAIHVGLVTDQPRAPVRIPSPRLLRSVPAS